MFEAATQRHRRERCRAAISRSSCWREKLDGSPPLLVVENPTRGLDIRATQDVHDRLRAAAASGAAVVIFFSDLDEVLSLAQRVLVMHAGAVRECERDRDVVGRAMLGVA